MGKISVSQLSRVTRLYYKNKLSMRELALNLGVSLDAVVYFMRRHGLKRRNFSETNRLRFERKKPSFKERPLRSVYLRELKAVGTMLYWGEGYKGAKSSNVDFANSDPEMVLIFLNYLRGVFSIDENKLRILLYCYSDQNVNDLIRYWSRLTRVPRRKFFKPYIRKDFKVDGRKMKYGLVHVRYIDKKLLLKIKDFINFYKKKFCVGSPVGSGSGL